MGWEIHGLNFIFDELIEFALVHCPQPVETGTAYDLFLEPLEQTRPFFAPDEDVELVDCADWVEELFENHFSEEAGGAGD